MARREDILSTPIKQIDLEKAQTISQLVEQFKHSSIQSRNLGSVAQVYEDMLTDEARPTVIIGLAGPLIAAGLRKVLRDMVTKGIVDVIVSTGAVLYQDFYQARGFKHYRGTEFADDVELHEHMIDRIYDTYVDEDMFRATDTYIADLVQQLEKRPYSTREFLHFLGMHIPDDDSILHQAAKNGVPCFVPALNDSSIGIGLTKQYVDSGKEEPKFRLDPIRDNWELTQIKVRSKKTGVIYIGGGTPKNYINDIEVIAEVMGYDPGGHHYALQITADAPHWGGLSGSTLGEAQSWGKINAKANKATAYVEASIGLSLMVGHVLQKKEIWQDRKRLRFNWSGDQLEGIEQV